MQPDMNIRMALQERAVAASGIAPFRWQATALTLRWP